MTHRRDAVLMVLGIAIGSAITAFLFYSLTKRKPFEQTEQAAVEPTIDSGSSSKEEPTVKARTARDISGSCVLMGAIRDPEGRGIEDALVRLRLLDEPWLSSDLPHKTRTDSAGRFQIDDLDEKLEYQIWAWAPGRAVVNRMDAVCGAQTNMVIEKGASLNLSFTKPNGDPIGPVQFLLAGGALWPARRAHTDADGAITIAGLEPGEYVLWAEGDRFAYVSDEPIRMELDRVTVAEIELVRAGEARVTILDSAGAPPQKGATVIVEPLSSSLLHRVALVDRQGTAIISAMPPGTYTASVLADKYVRTEPALFQPGDDITIRLERGASVSGVVSTSDRQPVAQASAFVEQEMGSSLVAVPAGRGRSFGGRIAEAVKAGWPMLYEVPGTGVIPGPLHMPLPKSQLGIPHKSGPAWRLTDNAGRFLLDSLPSGRISLSARHLEYVPFKSAELTLEQGGVVSDVVVLMRPGSTATVRTVNGRGYPIGDAEISVFGADDEPLAGAVSRSDGYATITGLPGSFRIEAVAEYHVPAAKEVKGKIGADNEIEIALPLADKTLYGRVTNQNGFGVPGAIVTARAATKGLAQVLNGQTKADGSFAFDGAGAGSYLVVADAGKQGRAQVSNAYFDEDIKLVITGEGAKETEFITPNEFAKALGSPHQIDNLGTTEPIEGERSGEIEATESVQTKFGLADKLSVTGPPSGKGGLPISIGGRAGQTVVTRVRGGSHVAVAGLSKGDRIIAIDGKKVAGPADARKAILGPIGSVVMLKVKNEEGETFNVVVQRVRVK